MKYFLFIFFLVFTSFVYSQKYVLLDKTMAQPVAYTNTVTAQHTFNNLFVVEKAKITQFIIEIEKIAAKLADTKKALPEAINFNLGKTKFFGVRVANTKESRVDVVLTTNCDGVSVMMHLCDPKISNGSNAYFIKTWIKYIKSSLK